MFHRPTTPPDMEPNQPKLYIIEENRIVLDTDLVNQPHFPVNKDEFLNTIVKFHVNTQGASLED